MERYIFLLLIAVSFFWGTGFAAVKISLRELHPLNLLILRCVCASIMFSAILWKKRKESVIIKAQDIPTFVVLGFMGITSYFYIQITGLQYTTTINSTLIIATSPIMVAVISVLLRIEKINKMMILGIVIAFTGVTLIISHGKWNGLLQSNTLQGDVMILYTSIVWAGFTLYGKKIMLKYSPLIASAYIQIFGTILLLPGVFMPGFFAANPLMEEVQNLSMQTILAVLYLAVFCSVYAYYLWYTAVAILGAVRTTAFMYLNPLFAMLAGLLLLGETISFFTVFGGCMIIIGVYVTNKFKITIVAKEVTSSQSRSVAKEYY